MIKTKKFILPFLLVIAAALCSMLLMGFTLTAEAASYNSMLFSEEKYTESDNLLTKDGIESDKTIQQFATEVKSAIIGESFPELSEVIPYWFLESNEDGVLKYFGKEYGYYVEKTSITISVLLVDFIYEFDDSNHTQSEWIIKIKPILQQTFRRATTESGYTYCTMIGGDLYYIANPRFFAVLQNENALNYGDAGYSKAEDNGLIIDQTRVNYGSVVSPNTSILANVLGSFTGDKILDYGLEELDPTGLLGVVKDMIGLYNDIKEAGKTVTVLANNEPNILTNYSHDEQQDNSEPTYSRIAGFAPTTDIILSDDSASSAEFIIKLNNTNKRSRLIQVCDFDIYKKGSGVFDSFEYVTGAESDNSFSTSREQILFEDQAPKFEFTENNVEGEDIPVYLLPNGKQTIAFEPEYSAYYSFDFIDFEGLTLSVIDSDGNVVKANGYYYLKDGEKYNIVITAGDQKIITSLGIGLADGKNSGTIYAKERQLVKLSIVQSDVYNLSTDNSNCLIDDILIKSSSGLNSYSEYSGYTPNSIVSVPLQEGEYYVLIYNSSSVNNTFNLGAEKCAVGELGKTNTVNTDGINYVYIKFNITTGDYMGTISDFVNYKVLNSYMESTDITRYSNGNFDVENNYDGIYVGVLADEGTVNVLLNLSENSSEWRINGEVVDNNNVYLERGEKYVIDYYINGIAQGEDFIDNLDNKSEEFAEGIDFSGNILTIKDYCLTNESFTISYSLSALAESKSKLNITPHYTVTFKGINSVTNDDTLSFSWIQTDDLATVYYQVSNGTTFREESVDTAGCTVGSTYSEDLTKYLSVFGISNVTIKIYKIDVLTSKGAMPVDLLTPFEATVHMAYGSGNGTKSNPYIISCNRHFENLNLTSPSTKYYFSMTETLSFSSPVIKDFYGVINYSDKETNTTYNGPAGRIIYDCYVEDGSLIENNYGTIMNIEVQTRIRDFDRTTVYYIGGMVKNNKSSGVISHCGVILTCSSTKIAKSYIGGIANVNNGRIEHCHVNSQITTLGDYGSVAYENKGIIDDCSANGAIIQEILKSTDLYINTYVGGMAAKNSGTIKNCSAGNDSDSPLQIVIVVDYVDDEEIHPYSGPIVGENTGTVSDCENEHFYMNTGNLHSWRKWFITYSQLTNINNII